MIREYKGGDMANSDPYSIARFLSEGSQTRGVSCTLFRLSKPRGAKVRFIDGRYTHVSEK